MNQLEKLMYLTGVSAEYFDFFGNRNFIGWEDRLRVLQELGYDPADAQAVDQAVFDLDARPWLSWLQSCHIASLGSSEHVDIRVPETQLREPIHWRLTTDTGQSFTGELIPAELAEVGEYTIGDIRHSARRLPLADLPVGYHRIALESPRRQECATLLVAPERCFEADAGQRREWGISCQLYTLRSARNWGIGDFTDLAELVEFAAAAKMDMVALNPLHSPHLAGSDIASPYSPSDRRFLNPLYIDPEQVEDFHECGRSREAQDDLQRQLSTLRALDHVDYHAVAALKYAVFGEMFQHFVTHHEHKASARAAAFAQFVHQLGERLESFAAFESRHCGLSTQSTDDPRFHQYLQWLAHQQLARCQGLALSRGMKVGLMRDLALGAIKSGAEVTDNPGLFCENATIGAPPDPLAEQGQNWGLPAPRPVALRANDYRQFIDLLQSNMVDCGALRIDHVLGLLRLWWCLPGGESGAYVYYPLEDLLAILRLESHRNRCRVVGEDMGVVPDELRARMRATGVYGNKLFYFERTPEQEFKPPQDHQSDALLMVSNHDVPTLAGWWDATDIALRAEIGLIDEQRDVPPAIEQRKTERGRLLSWLQDQRLLPETWADFPLDKAFDLELCGAVLRANARSECRMMLFQIDDLQLERAPVNVPGTFREYPNWRRKLAIETRTLFNDPAIRSLLASIYEERTQ